LFYNENLGKEGHQLLLLAVGYATQLIREENQIWVRPVNDCDGLRHLKYVQHAQQQQKQQQQQQQQQTTTTTTTTTTTPTTTTTEGVLTSQTWPSVVYSAAAADCRTCKSILSATEDKKSPITTHSGSLIMP
jgi:hypothetical protein